MKNWFIFTVLVYFLVCLPNLLRPYPVGNDSYYYASFVNKGLLVPNYPPLFFMVFNIFGGSFLAMKLIPFVFGLVNTLGVVYIAKRLKTKHWYLAGILVCLSFGWVFANGFYEEDVLGVTFILGTILSMFSVLEGRGFKSYIILANNIIFGLLTWRGYLLVLFGVALFIMLHKKFIWVVPIIAVFLLFCWVMLGVHIPKINDGNVTELNYGFLYFLPYLSVLIFAPFFSKLDFKESEKHFLFGCVSLVFLLAGLYVAKFVYLNAVLFAVLFSNSDFKRYSFKKILILGLFVFFAVGFKIYYAPPTVQDIEFVKGSMLNNTVDQLHWNYGHWVTYFGGNPIRSGIKAS